MRGLYLNAICGVTIVRSIRNDKAMAYAAVISKSIIYGLTVIFVSELLNSADVWDILAFRFLLSAALFLGLRLFKMVKVNFKGKSIKILLVTAIFEPFLYFVFETLGVKYTSTITVGIITAAMPAFVVAFEFIFLKERTTIAQKLFLLLRVLGVMYIMMMSGDAGENSVKGIVFMVLAIASGAMFIICSRMASKDFTALEVTYFTNIFGAVVFNGINLVRHIAAGTVSAYFNPIMNLNNLAAILFLGICASTLATVLNNYALSKLQGSLISSFGGLTTLTTLAMGVLIKNESFLYYHWIGTALILVGIIGMSYATEKTTNELSM